MYRYRLIDEDGADLGPLISPRVTFAIGQDIVRRAEERYEIVRIVEPENESFHAYLVVRSR